jgi:crotonobetainyl-CoA:carnitine CoA-transferase CaiB-like acyl-CoA transferase
VRAPGHGEHTDEILEGIGLDWDAVIDLKMASVVL